MEAEYVIQLNEPSFRPAITMERLIKNRVYVLTGVRKIRSSFGERYIGTFDEDIDVFMPGRFGKDYEDDKLCDQLIFYVRITEDGYFGNKLYALYKFIRPRKNGCICHVKFLWHQPPSTSSNASASAVDAGETSVQVVIPDCACIGICEKGLREPFCPCMVAEGRGSFKVNNLDVYIHKVKQI